MVENTFDFTENCIDPLKPKINNETTKEEDDIFADIQKQLEASLAAQPMAKLNKVPKANRFKKIQNLAKSPQKNVFFMPEAESQQIPGNLPIS